VPPHATDIDACQTRPRFLRTWSTAPRATPSERAPPVSTGPFAAAADFTPVYTQVSRLAQPTQAFLRDPQTDFR
jgi:hypothetical protein